jgi:hypothetical protein
MPKLLDSDTDSELNNHFLCNNNTSDTNTDNDEKAEGLPSSLNRNPNKKYRHQFFSKNIYIGTKNAEKWDYLRNRLQFKNDVEFVSFLLSLAETQDECKRRRIILNGSVHAISFYLVAKWIFSLLCRLITLERPENRAAEN